MKVIIHDALIRGDGEDFPVPGTRADGASVLFRAAPLGVTPLCWRRANGTLHVASQPADLARLVPATPNEAVLRSLLTWDFPGDDASPFDGIRRVPGGCQSRVTAEGSSLERWWTLDPEPFESSPPVDLWQSLVLQCATDLRDGTRGAVMLSGGIDSAAIAAAAVEASRLLGKPMPLLLSAAYPGLECDERPMQEAVAHHLGVPHVVHDATKVALWPTLGEAVRDSLSPLVDGQEGINLELYLVARAGGCDVLLHGVGGDELFEGRGLEVDLVRGGRWGAAAALIKSALTARPDPALRTWLRRGIRYPLQPARLGTSRKDRLDAGSWCRAVVRRTLANPGLDWRLEMAERTCRRAGLHFAAPFLGQSFLQAYQRIPSPQLASGGVFKGVLRDAVATRLPAGVVTRIQKARFAPYYHARLAVDGEPMSVAYAELAREYQVSWLPREVGSFLRKPLSPMKFLPLWMGLAILLFIDALSNSTRRIQ